MLRRVGLVAQFMEVTEEIDEDREEREDWEENDKDGASEAIDSGDEVNDEERARDERRPWNDPDDEQSKEGCLLIYKGCVGRWSKVVRCTKAVCACERAEQMDGRHALMLTAGAGAVIPTCGVSCGVGRSPSLGSGERVTPDKSAADGLRGISANGSPDEGLSQLAGLLGAVEVDEGEEDEEAEEAEEESAGEPTLDNDHGPSARESSVSSSGVRIGMTVRQHIPSALGMPLAFGVYFRTISFQRWKTASDMCRRQSTAWRNMSSFWLISAVLRPEILLQARAE